jgi:hypothetical protein
MKYRVILVSHVPARLNVDSQAADVPKLLNQFLDPSRRNSIAFPFPDFGPNVPIARVFPANANFAEFQGKLALSFDLVTEGNTLSGHELEQAFRPYVEVVEAQLNGTLFPSDLSNLLLAAGYPYIAFEALSVT